MKRVMVLVMMLWLGLSAQAQEQETLFNRAKVVGGFGAPIVEFSRFNGDIRTAVGGGGGLIIDNFFLGAYGMGSPNIDEIIDGNDDLRVDLGHGGFWLGYNFQPYSLVHIFSSAKIGWGALEVHFDDRDLDADHIFVFTPELGAELNVFSFMKIALTAGYRWVDGINTVQIDEDAYDSFVTTLTFRFGGFGNYRTHFKE